LDPSAFRAIRGRHYRPLQNRAGSEPSASQNRGKVEAMRAGTASGRRRRSSIARMAIGKGHTRTRRLIFWGSRFGPGKQTDARESFVVSVQPSRRLRLRECGMRFEDGKCIAVRGSPSEILRGRSIPNFEGGSTTMGASCLRRSGPSRGMSANRWFAGLVGNTRSYAITGVGHGHG
jgi:hypothetical protein